MHWLEPGITARMLKQKDHLFKTSLEALAGYLENIIAQWFSVMGVGVGVVLY